MRYPQGFLVASVNPRMTTHFVGPHVPVEAVDKYVDKPAVLLRLGSRVCRALKAPSSASFRCDVGCPGARSARGVAGATRYPQAGVENCGQCVSACRQRDAAMYPMRFGSHGSHRAGGVAA